MFRRAAIALLANKPDALAAYPALLNIAAPVGRFKKEYTVKIRNK